LGDAIFFETTGAVEADTPVGAETLLERSEKLLNFTDAIEAGTRMLESDVQLKHFVDVRALRKSNF